MRPAPARFPARRPPSMLRQFILGVLRLPVLARELPFPEPDEHTPEAAALTALVKHCAESAVQLTTSGVLQAFAGTPHEELFVSILAAAGSDPLDDVELEAEMREGLERWWQQARRHGRPAPAMAENALPAEEGRRIAQLDYVRQRSSDEPGLALPDAPDGRSAEGPTVI